MTVLFVFMFILKWMIVSSNPIVMPSCKSSEGNCENMNDLCEFIPLPHILCSREKIRVECPKLCNDCPNETDSETRNVTDLGKESNHY